MSEYVPQTSLLRDNFHKPKSRYLLHSPARLRYPVHSCCSCDRHESVLIARRAQLELIEIRTVPRLLARVHVNSIHSSHYQISRSLATSFGVCFDSQAAQTCFHFCKCDLRLFNLRIRCFYYCIFPTNKKIHKNCDAYQPAWLSSVLSLWIVDFCGTTERSSRAQTLSKSQR